MPVLTSKGQVTIPKQVRDRLKVKEGDSVVFEVMGEVVVVRKDARKSILSLGGVVHGEAKESINKARRGRRS